MIPHHQMSDCHDLFFNESSSSLINSTSESENTNTTAIDVHVSQTKIPLYEKSEFTVLKSLTCYFQWFTEHPSISKAAFSDLL